MNRLLQYTYQTGREVAVTKPRVSSLHYSKEESQYYASTCINTCETTLRASCGAGGVSGRESVKREMKNGVMLK